MIHPDFKLIEPKDPDRHQDGPVLLNPTVGEIINALVHTDAHSETGLALLREPMNVPPHLNGNIWLQTSGTTGNPKLIEHNVDRLISRIRPIDAALPGAPEVWLLTYHPASYAGLQVILTAALRGAMLVIGGVEEAVTHNVTHISGTATFWRLFLSGLNNRSVKLEAATLGGERADQVILDRLAHRFPNAHLTHIYASTEAGAVFAVQDGREGFPVNWLEHGPDGVSLRVNADGELEVKSPRAITDEWIATGDLVEQQGDRILFAGRIDDLINMGGVKVRPNQIEDIALFLEGVADACCYGKANPITGQIVALEVIAGPGQDEDALKKRLKQAFAGLDRAAQPRLIRLVEQLRTGAGNKKIRNG